MTGKNMMKLFCYSFVFGAVALGLHFVFVIKRCPSNMPLATYQVIRLCDWFSWSPFGNKLESYQAAHPEKYPVEKTDYYKTQLIIGEDDPLQLINAADIIKDRAEIDATHAVYAIYSGTVVRIAPKGSYCRVTIDSGKDGQGRFKYPTLLNISPIEEGDRVEGGYYLGEAKM